MKDKKVIGWYYKGIGKVLEKEFAGVPAFEEYRELVKKHFGE